MSEILSQNQIDELLSELMGDHQDSPLDMDDKKIKPYNFKTPKKLSREQQKVLAGIHEVFARHLAAYLAGLTRSYCEVAVVSIEEHPYYEYNNALPDIRMTGIIDINILKGAVLLDMSSSVAFALIARMFGGSAEERRAPDRDFTEIEIALIDRIFKKAAVFVEEAWGYIPDVSATLRQIETNTRLIKSIGMDDTVAVIVFDVSINTVKGTVTCCVPCMSIGEVLDRFHADHSSMRGMDEGDVEKNRKALLSHAGEAAVELCGILGTSTITMREAVRLQPGDVIKLDQYLGTPVLVTVNGKKWFQGRPGTSRHQMAVRIDKPYHKEGRFS